MNTEPALIFFVSCFLATLVAVAGLIYLTIRSESKKPTRIRVPVEPVRRFISRDKDFDRPDDSGFGTRYSNRGPPVPAPSRPSDANPGRRSS